MKWRRKFWQKDGCSGESIVEVMVAAVIFLMLMAVLQGAVMFCHSAGQKSQQIRQNTARISEALHKADQVTAVDNGSEVFAFYAVSADGTVVGKEVFSITAPKQKKTVKYNDASGARSSVIFYMFGTAGGGTP